MKRSSLRARSKKRARLMRQERVPLVKEMLERRPRCALGASLWDFGKVTRVPVLDNCLGEADCIHERRKRSQGGSLTKRENLVPLCSPCNSAVESDAEVARLAHTLGLVVRRGDPGYDELGAD